MFYIEILVEGGRIWWYIDSYMVECMVTAWILIPNMVGPPKYVFFEKSKGLLTQKQCVQLTPS